jgi:energy-coupling factor transport system permease protein
MKGMFSTDIENRGLVLDPRTKLTVMIALVVFSLGGAGSGFYCVRAAVIALCLLPTVLLFTARRYKKALLLAALFVLVKSAEIWLVPQFTGAALSISSIVCMFIVRLMPSLVMGSYMLSTTTVSEFTAAMQRMHIPQNITIPLSVMFRFFPTVTEEFSSINAAMKMRDIRIGGKGAGKLIEYRLVPLMVCSVNIGSELSAAALTRGLGTKTKRTNICKIGFRLQDLTVLLLVLSVFVLWVLGMAGVIK